MRKSNGTGRRGFLRSVALAGGLTANVRGAQAQAGAPANAKTGDTAPAAPAASSRAPFRYPRTYTGRQLAMIAFPLGGIGTGSISLGGRGQLRDWEIFNRPDKGRSPEYAFASIWARSGDGKPVARVLEARLMPPYQATRGLGPDNAPGLTRLQSASFTGEFPLAHIDFRDARLPVKVSLEAFSPFIPLDAEESGLPVAFLRYRVRNTGSARATVSIAFSVDNPVGAQGRNVTRRSGEQRTNEYRDQGDLRGFVMRNPALEANDPQNGSFTLALVKPGDGQVTYLGGWSSAKWWASPMLFWDDFSADGELGPEPASRKATASLCLKRDIEAGAEAEYTFLLSWHFPNRTSAWCGWTAPKGEENTIIGNYYATRFADSWKAAEYAAVKMAELESRTRRFVETVRQSTLPAPVLDAAMANLSTLATQTCFRTADGEFHGFEGCDDQRGCCFGNCTHVWNYETATQALFPGLARSLRKAAFGYSQDEQGGMRFRQMLPDGKDRFGFAAADGQMGQIIKAYLDWRASGDTGWLRSLWPAIKRGVEFAWIPGGWDADRDGVMEGVQHNTYDVEFYGPNPLSGIYYLGGLRAAEEMARAVGDASLAADYRRLFEKGKSWIDRELFNGEYYVQKVRSIPRENIAPATVGNMGSESSDEPEFQLGDGCLADQLIGQYLADVAGLGPLVDVSNARKALAAIRKYNYRDNLFEHDSVQRIYVINDEAAVLVCDYGKGTRPRIPFPYYAEAWTGIEYLFAAQLIFAGMVRDGVACFENVRRRFDGERRNPWNEPECGHHYARAMSAWSGVLALGGLRYSGIDQSFEALPRQGEGKFACFWSSPFGWGGFSRVAQPGGPAKATLSVTEGALPLRSVVLAAKSGAAASVTLGARKIGHRVRVAGGRATVELAEEITVKPGESLVLTV